MYAISVVIKIIITIEHLLRLFYGYNSMCIFLPEAINVNTSLATNLTS